MMKDGTFKVRRRQDSGANTITEGSEVLRRLSKTAAPPPEKDLIAMVTVGQRSEDCP